MILFMIILIWVLTREEAGEKEKHKKSTFQKYMDSINKQIKK